MTCELVRGPGSNEVSGHVTRIPAGHPEGYLEGFANLYSDVAEAISARLETRDPNPMTTTFPSIEDGVKGMIFIEAAINSSENNSHWVDTGLGQ